VAFYEAQKPISNTDNRVEQRMTFLTLLLLALVVAGQGAQITVY
jgi:hypothetical protein